MSIRDNVVAGLKLQGERDKKKLDEVAEQSLRGANLWNEVKDRLDKPGGGLSGGQQQRLCIARAIAVQPDVLLMDEPCSALDPISTLAIEDLITELKKDFTIVIVTHNMQQAARVSDQTAFFNLEATGQVRVGSSRSTTPRRSSPTRPRRPPRTTSRVASADPAPGVSRRRRPRREHPAGAFDMSRTNQDSVGYTVSLSTLLPSSRMSSSVGSLPVTRKITRRPTSTAWSAKRS